MEPIILRKDGFLPFLLYPIILSLFFLGGSILYNPFDIVGYYSFGAMSFSFHLVMLSCIILICSFLTRTCLYFILKKHGMQWLNYGLYCIIELTVMSSFVTLYTVLFKGTETGYFFTLPMCIKFIFLSLIYPYTFLTLIYLVKMKDMELERRDMEYDNSLLRFYDEHKRLKLSIAPSAILYVKSEFNYVQIHYLDGAKVKTYMLRASMKSLEDIGSKALTRCQRSYFVNPEHISVLRKDPQGFIFAEMNLPDVEAVPVSKQYYNKLTALL